WSVQADVRVAGGVWQRPGVELAACRGEHCGPRDRHGGARAEAGGRDPVLRLHLAGDAPDAERAVGAALAVEWGVQLPGGDAGPDRRISDGRVDLPLAVGGEHLHAYAGDSGGDAVECAGCARAAADGD